ncbi:NADPH-dependent F420 reductase [Pedobacter gandavensis]|uniref:NADPH-dependent F420 reductase n=1 Tax=Pedobacter gandavensis TaxID=2679963 RepID=UPI0029315D33|nr:NAD(P)-binding domain-containing protein [Pedobacter gandavensis]
MKIGIIGAGSIGFNLAKKLAPNHSIVISASKLSDELKRKVASINVTAVDIKDVVKNVDVVILSIPTKIIPELPKDLFNDVPDNVIIVDTSNYYPFRDGHILELDEGKIESVWVSEQLGRPVVKAFNNLLAHTLVQGGTPNGTPGRIAISIAGDNDEPKLVISNLIDELGFDTVDTGKLEESWRQQPGTPAYCTELNKVELKDALTIANKANAPQLRDQVMEYLIEKQFNLSHEEIVENNRLIYSKAPPPGLSKSS